MLVACIPLLVRSTVEPGHALEWLAIILVPMLAATLRGAIGISQLEMISKGKPSFSRQCLFGLAIVLLLMMEVLVSTLQFARNAPWSLWFFPAGMFCLYLILIQNALEIDDEQQRVDWI